MPVGKGFLGGLARRLLNDGLLGEEQAVEAQRRAQATGVSLVSLLAGSGMVAPAPLAAAVSREFGVPLVDLSPLSIDTQLAQDIGEKVLRRHCVLPLFRRGGRLYVAMSDPSQVQALEDIQFASGLHTEALVVEHDKLLRAVDRLVTLDHPGSDNRAHERGDAAPNADDAPVVRYIDKVLRDAIRRQASDIHFEPYEQFCRVRLRLDGQLVETARPPVEMAPRIAARLKVLARLDLAERRLPQDGRIKLPLSAQRSVDLRVSTCPTLWGEKVVLRILDADSARMDIDALGFEPEQKALYLKALQRPQGMILVTGPTGSGKTMSLYSGLNILNREGVNISTAEDPAEINLPGANQVNINPRVGLTFAAALRAFLRQDPDIIMVGEMRDPETAEIAVKAAQTGHLVLSTVHTNDAPQTLTRLLNMGVPAYNIASSVTVIIAQRLVRKLCTRCRRPADIPREALLREGFTEAELNSAGFTFYQAHGCDECNGGYKGRTGVYQTLWLSDEIGRIILRGGTALDIARQARREGVMDLRRAAMRKVRDGTIDLVEANRAVVD